MNPPPSDAVPRQVLARLRLVCLELPEVVEESAWEGVRWCVRGKNFAHVLAIAGGRPEAYARAAGTAGPAIVLTFRLSPQACKAERFRRAPFFRPVWFANIAGLRIDAATDWDEVDVDCEPITIWGSGKGRAPACDPFIRGMATQLWDRYAAESQVLLDGAFSDAAMTARIDELVALVRDAVDEDPDLSLDGWLTAVDELREAVIAKRAHVAAKL